MATENKQAAKPNTKPTLSPREIVERAEAHPAAVPFLWLGREKTQRNFIFVPFVLTVVFSILGYFFPPHHSAPWDFEFSYAVIGFASYSFVVIMAWPLFKLLSRDENYYGEEHLGEETGAEHNDTINTGDKHA